MHKLFCFITATLVLFQHTAKGQKIDLNKHIINLADSNRFNKLLKSVQGKNNALTDSTSIKINRYIRSIQNFSGKRISNIQIEQNHFASNINNNDTKWIGSIETLADKLHDKTNENTLLKNLFFKTGDTLSPIIVAYNEKWLRDLNYIQDARIFAFSNPFDSNSVSIRIFTKDIFPLGGSINVKGEHVIDNAIDFENLNDAGNAFSIHQNYDLTRKEKWGLGATYILRNLRGSFWNAKATFIQNSSNYIDNKMSATVANISINKPLLHPLDSYTAGIEWGINNNNNMYYNDSIYSNNYQYKMLHTEGWLGIQLFRKQLINNLDAPRHILQFRYQENNFNTRPFHFTQYLNRSFYPTELFFSSYTLFQQKIIRTQYLYGLGRNEDLPTGQSFTITTGAYHREAPNLLPYLGLQWEQYRLLQSEHFNHINVSVGSSYLENQLQDFRLLANYERISKIHYLPSGFRHRNIYNFSFATTLKNKFNEPLLINSIYGIPQLTQERINGGTRLNANYESIWYNSSSFLGFKSAPFAFANLTYIRTIGQAIKEGDIYSAIGGGLRVRNENLIFGTIELKGFYFPRTNLQLSPFNISLNTNIRFKYNSSIINKPDFVSIN